MSLSLAIAKHLPYLRRYARALCGSQESGDAYVRACLEAIIADTSVLDPTASPRVGLYRLFLKLWATTDLATRGVAGSTAGGGSAASVEGRLGQPPPAHRQSLLLTAMEGFTVNDTASSLGAPEDQVAGMVTQAVREIAKRPSTKVLILEDAPIISLD